MRIDSYSIGMDSERLYKSSSYSRLKFTRESISGQGSENPFMSLSDYVGGGQAKENESEEETGLRPVRANAANGIVKETEQESAESVTNKELVEALEKLRDSVHSVQKNRLTKIDVTERNTANEFQKLHQLMLRRIFDLMFGDRYKRTVRDDSGEVLNETSNDIYDSNGELIEDSWAGNLMTIGAGSFQLVTTNYTSSGYFSEQESTSFSALGEVRTQDGKAININVNVSMSRSFAAYYESNYSVTNLRLTDPLVVNFDGNLAGLEKDMDFFFDLDMDGEEEKIARLTQGSAFLALDLNEDGKINDGGELFGVESGDGFKDLSKYDEDGNGWIDENDSVFTKLKLWSKDLEGNDVLYTLKEKDIGAIYLGSAQTDFTLTGESNAARGYVRQTGLFLYESGEAGTVQHIDLVS